MPNLIVALGMSVPSSAGAGAKRSAAAAGLGGESDSAPRHPSASAAIPPRKTLTADFMEYWRRISFSCTRSGGDAHASGTAGSNRGSCCPTDVAEQPICAHLSSKVHASLLEQNGEALREKWAEKWGDGPGLGAAASGSSIAPRHPFRATSAQPRVRPISGAANS